MIVTLTLNPAIDRTIEVLTINKDDVTLVEATHKDPAGKGINVAKTLMAIDHPVVITGLLAGAQGAWIESELTRMKSTQYWVHLPGETRENIKVIARNNHTVIELNEKGPVASLTDMQSLLEVLDSVLQPKDILVCAGSLPQGLDDNTYETIIERYQARDIVVIIDTSKAPLAAAIKAKPTVIKPNRYELELLANQTFETDEAMLYYASQLALTDVPYIFISCGDKGAYAVSKDQIYYQAPIKVPVQSVVGAGDAFVAGIAYAQEKGYTLSETLHTASAMATAAVMTGGTKPGTQETIDYCYKNIQIRKVR